MVWHIGRYLAGATVLGYGAVYALGRTAGSTTRERGSVLPGDDIVARPHIVTNHAVTIDAPADAVWPWLCQMGWHLGGYYTPRWVDRLLFPQNWSSLDQLDPALVRDLTVGDLIPDGGPGTAWFTVAEIAAPRTLVLHSISHLPPSWRERFKAAIDWTWTFQLTPLPGSLTRLHLRVRARSAPWWLTAGYHVALVPADLIMAVGMLSGIKQRAESARPWAVSGREPFVSAAPGST
jgi:hypothetical protein